MQKIDRVINTAMDLARSNGIESTTHQDAIIGAMARKLADGLADQAIYDVGHSLAKTLAERENGQRGIAQMLQSIKLTGNPLLAETQAG